jgi:hypothetical protein
MCPGNNITGGKRRAGTTTKGSRWLRETLDQCAVAASHTRETYLAAQYWRLARRIGKKKAAVAVGHSILVICWHLLANDCDYEDLGGDYFARRTDNAATTSCASYTSSDTGSPSPTSLPDQGDSPYRRRPPAPHWSAFAPCGTFVARRPTDLEVVAADDRAPSVPARGSASASASAESESISASVGRDPSR